MNNKEAKILSKSQNNKDQHLWRLLSDAVAYRPVTRSESTAANTAARCHPQSLVQDVSFVHNEAEKRRPFRQSS